MITKVKGIAIDFSGRVLVVPPLNLKSLQQLQERLEKFQGSISPESVETVIEATHAALLRNYPELSKDEVSEMIDLGNMMEVMEAVMDVSGLKRKAAEAMGEPKQGEVIGATSTPT